MTATAKPKPTLKAKPQRPELEPTKGQWAEIERELKGIFGCIYLRCDGYLVAAQKRQVRESRLAIVVYVDGYFRGRWSVPDKDTGEWAPEARFYPLKVVQDSKAEAAANRRFAMLTGRPLPEPFRYEYRIAYWTAARYFIRQLRRECRRIEWITAEQHEAELDAKRSDKESTP